jgi:hypothetical protein
MTTSTPIALTITGGPRFVGFHHWSARAVRAFAPHHSGWRCLRGPFLRPAWTMNQATLCLLPPGAEALYIYGRRGTDVPAFHLPLVSDVTAPPVTIPLSTAPSPADVTHIAGLLEGARWTFAKTMADNPHFYTARRHWRSDADFAHVVAFIRRFGHAQRYGSYIELVFEVGEHFYWSGALPIDQTGWINRKPRVDADVPFVDQSVIVEGARILELPEIPATSPFFRTGCALFGYPHVSDLRPRLRRTR